MSPAKKGSSPAGNIIETYKTIAEQVIAYREDETKNETPEDFKASSCVQAAREHLKFINATPSKDNTAVYTSFPTTHGYSGCVVWLYILDDAKRVAQQLTTSNCNVEDIVLQTVESKDIYNMYITDNIDNVWLLGDISETASQIRFHND